jgi:hypothetical protein
MVLTVQTEGRRQAARMCDIVRATASPGTVVQ